MQYNVAARKVSNCGPFIGEDGLQNLGRHLDGSLRGVDVLDHVRPVIFEHRLGFALVGFEPFSDDVVVRVQPEAASSSRVDVRSLSRVGKSDLGTNARRIREFLSRL